MSRGRKKNSTFNIKGRPLKKVGNCLLYGDSKRGQVRVNGKPTYAYVVYWEEAKGPVPPDHLLIHTCENGACCNVAHMECISKEERGRRLTKNRMGANGGGL